MTKSTFAVGGNEQICLPYGERSTDLYFYNKWSGEKYTFESPSFSIAYPPAQYHMQPIFVRGQEQGYIYFMTALTRFVWKEVAGTESVGRAPFGFFEINGFSYDGWNMDEVSATARIPMSYNPYSMKASYVMAKTGLSKTGWDNELIERCSPYYPINVKFYGSGEELDRNHYPGGDPDILYKAIKFKIDSVPFEPITVDEWNVH